MVGNSCSTSGTRRVAIITIITFLLQLSSGFKQYHSCHSIRLHFYSEQGLYCGDSLIIFKGWIYFVNTTLNNIFVLPWRRRSVLFVEEIRVSAEHHRPTGSHKLTNFITNHCIEHTVPSMGFKFTTLW